MIYFHFIDNLQYLFIASHFYSRKYCF